MPTARFGRTSTVDEEEGSKAAPLRLPSMCELAGSGSKCLFAAENGEFDRPVRRSQRESSVPYFSSESQECSDCSSIISSFSYQSLGMWGEEQNRTATYLWTIGDEEFATVEGMSCDLTQSHALVTYPSVVSFGAACTSPDEHERLEGNEVGEDSFSCTSSVFSSILHDEMINVQLSPWPTSERDSMSGFFGVLPDDLASYILSFLDVDSLREASLISRQARILSTRDEAGWRMHCLNLWSRKTFVPLQARDLLMSCKAMDAYKLSIYDANSREEIRPEELCFDVCRGEGVIWGFRFKESAGSIWTSLDPWWSGGNARKMVFLRDGTVKEIVQSHDVSQFVLYPPFHDVAHDASRSFQKDGMTWRFVEQPMDLPQRARGSYIRLTVDGREVPTYVVRRSQTGDWGFVMESCWGVYFMTPLTSLNVLASQHMRVRGPRIRLRRTLDGACWVNVDGIETDSEDDAIDEQVHQSVDTICTISPRRQWREALLYNFGAKSLPEGEYARAEFDRVWNQSFRQG
jgi:hypothetical protein